MKLRQNSLHKRIGQRKLFKITQYLVSLLLTARSWPALSCPDWPAKAGSPTVSSPSTASRTAVAPSPTGSSRPTWTPSRPAGTRGWMTWTVWTICTCRSGSCSFFESSSDRFSTIASSTRAGGTATAAAPRNSSGRSCCSGTSTRWRSGGGSTVPQPFSPTACLTPNR